MPLIDGPIVEVTVFSEQARITRRGRTRLLAGEQTLALGALPTTLDENSVRASGKGEGTRIKGVALQRRYVADIAEPRLAELNNQIENLEDADRQAADEEKLVRSRLLFTSGLRKSGANNLTRSLAEQKATLNDVKNLQQYLSDEGEAALAQRRAIQQRRRDLKKQIAALQAQLAPNSVGTQAQYEIQVVVEAASEADFELEVSYTVRGASWRPLYDARLVGGKLALTYRANIFQQTGEDWPALPLLLSTAQPSSSRNIPELKPWFVDIPRPFYPAAPRSMAASGGAARNQADSEALAAQALGEPLPQAPVAEASIESSGAAVTYRVAQAVAVASDNAPHGTTITTLELDPQLDYVTAPKLTEEAFLRAKTRNSSRFVFLPGPLSVFHEDDFVGVSDLELTMPDEQFETQLGADPRVKVERELSGRTANKNFIGSTSRTVYGYKIKITNLSDAAAQVTVFDQLPVSRNDDIKVKLQEATPQPVEQTELGIFRWELTIAPGRQQAIDFAFLVENPKNMNVVGLS